MQAIFYILTSVGAQPNLLLVFCVNRVVAWNGIQILFCHSRVSNCYSDCNHRGWFFLRGWGLRLKRSCTVFSRCGLYFTMSRHCAVASTKQEHNSGLVLLAHRASDKDYTTQSPGLRRCWGLCPRPCPELIEIRSNIGNWELMLHTVSDIWPECFTVWSLWSGSLLYGAWDAHWSCVL